MHLGLETIWFDNSCVFLSFKYQIYDKYQLHLHKIFVLIVLNSQQIVPPVLNSFLDQDSRVRYYACEALYNIAKVSLVNEATWIPLNIFFVVQPYALQCLTDFSSSCIGCKRRFNHIFQ